MRDILSILGRIQPQFFVSYVMQFHLFVRYVYGLGNVCIKFQLIVHNIQISSFLARLRIHRLNDILSWCYQFKVIQYIIRIELEHILQPKVDKGNIDCHSSRQQMLHFMVLSFLSFVWRMRSTTYSSLSRQWRTIDISSSKYLHVYNSRKEKVHFCS